MVGEATPGPAALARPGWSVLVVASEARPFAGTGELGDVVGALPAALGASGHRVTLVVPKYARVVVSSPPVDRFTVRCGATEEEAVCYELPLGPNARAILVEHPGFFEREHLYGDGTQDYADNPRRFAFLSRAALTFAAREGEPVDIVHAHDWQTALVPLLLRTEFAGVPCLASAASVLTIHDIAYQGLFDAGWVGPLGLDPRLLVPDGVEYWGRLSFLKAGVNFADLVTTLSRRYAEVLLTAPHGRGFEGILSARGDAFRGLLDSGDRLPDWESSEVAEALAAAYADARLRRGAGRATPTPAPAAAAEA